MHRVALGLVIVCFVVPALAESGAEVSKASERRTAIEVSAVTSVPVGNDDVGGFDAGWREYAGVGFGGAVGLVRPLSEAWSLTGKAGFVIHRAANVDVADLGPTHLKQFPITIGARYQPIRWLQLGAEVGPSIIRFDESSIAGRRSNTELGVFAAVGAAADLDVAQAFAAVGPGNLLGSDEPFHGNSLASTLQVLVGVSVPLFAL